MDAPATPVADLFMLKAALKLVGQSLRERGVLRTAKSVASRLIYFVRDSTPERRRARFGDLDFDIENGVDTTSARQNLTTRLRGLLSGSEYQATDPETFRQMMSALPLMFSQFIFLELGSGKGRAVLLASEYPFQRIIGVELLPELHAAARQNLERFPRERRRCSNIELYCMDARQFVFPREASVVYLFNPFPEVVLQEVVRNLRASVKAAPRPVFIVYYNPLLRRIVEQGAWLRALAQTEQWVIYRNGDSPTQADENRVR